MAPISKRQELEKCDNAFQCETMQEREQMITGELRKEFNATLFDTPVANSVFDKAHQNCRWNVFRDYEPQAMLGSMNQNVFPFIKMSCMRTRIRRSLAT